MSDSDERSQDQILPGGHGSEWARLFVGVGITLVLGLVSFSVTTVKNSVIDIVTANTSAVEKLNERVREIELRLAGRSSGNDEKFNSLQNDIREIKNELRRRR